jgi:hypothetical protein
MLESYDTTLYFVVFYIPLLPLGRKRILEQCSACQKHRVLSLQKWETTKEQAIARLLEALRANPDDRDTIQSAIALATFYGGSAFSAPLRETLVRKRFTQRRRERREHAEGSAVGETGSVVFTPPFYSAAPLGQQLWRIAPTRTSS